MSTAVPCSNHPDIDASYTCYVCHAPICEGWRRRVTMA